MSVERSGSEVADLGYDSSSCCLYCFGNQVVFSSFAKEDNFDFFLFLYIQCVGFQLMFIMLYAVEATEPINFILY